ncbi:MAG: SAM-dependent methyltransferase [Chloroflexi bacterium RBG_16_54_11]|nr:MAG: SAM-dependent methyltransferase [Chloroflexi bacterium RBG_16_54_11]
MGKKPGRTTTSSFGIAGRASHDSAPFYAGRLYHDQPQESITEFAENPLPESCLDRLFCCSSESMPELPDNSIHLMVTSPPYNVGKDYDADLTMPEYLAMLERVWAEVFRVLVPGGRACINVANLGRRPYIPLHAWITQSMLQLGYLMRGEIIWNKAASASPSTAWGSWRSAANPTLRDVHEYILVFSKGAFKRQNPLHKENTISKEDFLEFTKSVWTFRAEPARKVGHPAPFPVELPHRLIQLYSFKYDVVLDPFMGSGQTAIAALKSGRRYVGYELSPDYVSLANERIHVNGVPG